MNTKQYIKTFFDETDGKFYYDAFIAKFGEEFKERLEANIELNRKIQSEFTYQKFQHLVKEMDTKFNSIHNKLPGEGLKRGVFNGFFSKHVIPQRARLFPDIHRAISEKRQKYIEEEQERLEQQGEKTPNYEAVDWGY